MVIDAASFSRPVMGAFARITGSPRLLRGERTRKGTPGGSESGGEAISFSSQLRIATWNWCGLSNTLRLSWAHTWNGRAPRYTTNPASMCQTCPGITVRRCT